MIAMDYYTILLIAVAVMIAVVLALALDRLLGQALSDLIGTCIWLVVVAAMALVLGIIFLPITGPYHHFRRIRERAQHLRSQRDETLEYRELFEPKTKG